MWREYHRERKDALAHSIPASQFRLLKDRARVSCVVRRVCCILLVWLWGSGWGFRSGGRASLARLLTYTHNPPIQSQARVPVPGLPGAGLHDAHLAVPGQLLPLHLPRGLPQEPAGMIDEGVIYLN